MIPLVKDFLDQDLLLSQIDGLTIRGYRSPDSRAVWLRDYSDILRGIKYFEADLKSTIDHFATNQSASGRIFDFFTCSPDDSTRENWTRYVRVPVECDVEYRFVKAAWLAWQAHGDDDWFKRLLPNLELALSYIREHPHYWDQSRGLVKRPYTIDTWDFAYSAGKQPWLQFQITDDSFWGIMHGDNSGYYEAYRLMEASYRYFGIDDRANFWADRAVEIKERLNSLCWNGRFYRHFSKITPVTILGVDEENQLSLSNPININRGIASHDMAVSIIREYQQRRKHSPAFAEWFSIDPPFPDGIFGDDKLTGGSYVNGGIMPLVGAELARAAFSHGFESYGVDIIRRYYRMIAEKKATYLWYFPDGKPSSEAASTSPEASPTDGWGSSAMLYALIEGLAGVVDREKGFERISLSPRWPAAGVKRAEVSVTYGPSDRSISYEWVQNPDSIQLDLQTDSRDIDLQLLLPDRTTAGSVKLDNRSVGHRISRNEQSRYLNTHLSKSGILSIQLEKPDDETT